MTQPDDWQPELFDQFEAPTRPSWWARYWRNVPRFLVLRLAYEDLLLTAIAAVMVVVVSFCLGVERGKRVVVALAAPSPAAAPAVSLPAPSALVPPAATTAEHRYVVQVASFTARDQADAARARLSQYGVRASLVTKGKYQVLYAGGFSTYAQATAAADHLRAAYHDCFVRKLFAERG